MKTAFTVLKKSARSRPKQSNKWQKWGKMAKIARIVDDEKTRANSGHAVLISMLKPPKLKRHNGPMDQRTDRPTDRQTDPLIEVLIST